MRIIILVEPPLRAAVLGKLARHEAAAADLEAALVCGYPPGLRYKAHQRLAVAHTALGDPDTARRAYRQLLDSLAVADLPPDKVKKMKYSCMQTLKNLPLEAASAPSEVLDTSNSTFLDKIRVETTAGRGRFSVARVPIPAGSVVVADTACLVSVSPRLRATHCAVCGRDAVAPLPCPACRHVCFCSRACRHVGLAAHARQCRIAGWVGRGLSQGADTLAMPLLAALDLTLQQELTHHLDTFSRWKMNPEDSTEEITSFTKVLNMVKHFSVIDIKQHFAAAVFITMLLKHLDYLPASATTEEEAGLAVVVSHYLAAVKSNIHTVSQLEAGEGAGLVMRPVGVAMFPQVALHINHSCNPNTFVLDTAGGRQVTVAARDIAAGEEVTQIYLGHFGDTARPRRQQLLSSKYNFVCGCEACEHDFPSADQCLEMCKTFAETPASGLKRPMTSEDLAVLDMKNDVLRMQVELALENGAVAAAVELTLERMKLICDHLKEPHILYLMGRLSLVNYMWFLHANKSRWFKKQKLPTYF